MTRNPMVVDIDMIERAIIAGDEIWYWPIDDGWAATMDKAVQDKIRYKQLLASEEYTFVSVSGDSGLDVRQMVILSEMCRCMVNDMFQNYMTAIGDVVKQITQSQIAEFFNQQAFN